VKFINPYLIETKNQFIDKRRQPICKVPKIVFGSMPNDGGNLLISHEEYLEYKKTNDVAVKYIKPLIGSYEFLNGKTKWCFWLVKAEPNDLRSSNILIDILNKVKIYRELSPRKQTKELAKRPFLFGEIRQPECNYVLIPRVSSENRKFIPIGLFTKNEIAGDTCVIIPNATLLHFGVLTSTMHMAWVRTVCGRLKSDFRYSNEIVYNNFPWPENPSEKQIEAIEKAAQKVLDTRKEFPNSSLADLYDPLTMPPSLVKAHQELDKAVDLAYRPQPFPSEAKRMEFLFELYEKYTANLFTKEKVKAPKKRTGKTKE
ncbi:MAG: type IIL restriction-modification enzyme MmeI, partial [Crocinitomicaceae bacterium]